jgi:hypothetical protein
MKHPLPHLMLLVSNPPRYSNIRGTGRAREVSSAINPFKVKIISIRQSWYLCVEDKPDSHVPAVAATLLDPKTIVLIEHTDLFVICSSWTVT